MSGEKYPAQMVEKVARAICYAWGDNFDAIHRDKKHWTDTRGMAAVRFRDVNEPRQADYLDMAESALDAIPYVAEIALLSRALQLEKEQRAFIQSQYDKLSEWQTRHATECATAKGEK